MNQMADHDEGLNIRALERRLSELRGALSEKAIQIVRLRMQTREERQLIHELSEAIARCKCRERETDL